MEATPPVAPLIPFGLLVPQMASTTFCPFRGPRRPESKFALGVFEVVSLKG